MAYCHPLHIVFLLSSVLSASGLLQTAQLVKDDRPGHHGHHGHQGHHHHEHHQLHAYHHHGDTKSVAKSKSSEKSSDLGDTTSVISAKSSSSEKESDHLDTKSVLSAEKSSEKPSKKFTKSGMLDKPHILFILVDDLGWGDVGFTRDGPEEGLATPHMDRLASKGVRLDRHYVHKTCSPTRSAMQSGRAPIHVNVLNLEAFQAAFKGASDVVTGAQGIPRKMTGIAEVMRKAGYATHMVGKWDVGMATAEHTPAGRGYQSSLVYFNHDTDCWTFSATRSPCFIGHGTATAAWSRYYFTDLWEHSSDISYPGQPAVQYLNDPSCTYENQKPANGGKCEFMDAVFETRVHHIIHTHDVDTPLFLFWATRGIHANYQPPSAIEDGVGPSLVGLSSGSILRDYYETRADYYGMVRWVDDAIGRVVVHLKQKDLWDNMLIVLSSDNGATPGGNGFPLRGSKWSNWDGGIRAASFISGGFVPEKVRGTSDNRLIAAWDWYSTFAALAKVDPTDYKAAEHGLPAIDSINMWPMLSGENHSNPRSTIAIGDVVDEAETETDGKTTVGGLLMAKGEILYKLLLGMGEGSTLKCSAPANPIYIQETFKELRYPRNEFCANVEVCGRTLETGCLYDVKADPSERYNIAMDNPHVFRHMLERVDEENANVFSDYRGRSKNSAMCEKGLHEYGGFWGPFAE